MDAAAMRHLMLPPSHSSPSPTVAAHAQRSRARIVPRPDCNTRPSICAHAGTPSCSLRRRRPRAC